VCAHSSSVQNIQIGIVLNRVHYIQIDREVTVSNFEVFGKLVDVDSHDEDVESAFGDRDVRMGGHFKL
jgi:hypothetical protein